MLVKNTKEKSSLQQANYMNFSYWASFAQGLYREDSKDILHLFLPSFFFFFNPASE